MTTPETVDPITAAIRAAVAAEVAPLRALIEQLAGEPTEHRDGGDALTPDELAERWRCTRRHIYQLVARGRIVPIRIGDPTRGRMLVPVAEVERIEREGGGR